MEVCRLLADSGEENKNLELSLEGAVWKHV